MFQKRYPRDPVSQDFRMMMHAFVASWGSTDPYCQNGAALASKDILMNTAYGYIIGDSFNVNRPHWDDPNVYDYVMPAEIKVLERQYNEKIYDVAVYITTVPHPNSVREIFDRGIKRIVYATYKLPNLPHDYKKTFARLQESYTSAKVEPYTGKLYWMRDKLDLMEAQNPELFS